MTVPRAVPLLDVDCSCTPRRAPLRPRRAAGRRSRLPWAIQSGIGVSSGDRTFSKTFEQRSHRAARQGQVPEIRRGDPRAGNPDPRVRTPRRDRGAHLRSVGDSSCTTGPTAVPKASGGPPAPGGRTRADAQETTSCAPSTSTQRPDDAARRTLPYIGTVIMPL